MVHNTSIVPFQNQEGERCWRCCNGPRLPEGPLRISQARRLSARETVPVLIGFAAGGITTIKAKYLLLKNVFVTGLQWSSYRDRDPESVRRMQDGPSDLYKANKIKPHVIQAFPLEKFTGA